MEPLGIADIPQPVNSPRGWHLPEHFYWCRRHEQVHKVGEECQCDCTYSGGECTDPPTGPCIDVGPFMSEREANRLAAIAPGKPNRYRFNDPLGMDIEPLDLPV